MIKYILYFIAISTLILFVCLVFNIPFKLWPTSIGNHKLEITENVLLELHNLQNEKKFIPDTKSLYPGAPDEVTRLATEKIMNNLITQIVKDIKDKPEKAFVLSKFKSFLPFFDQFDSEEQDRVCFYLEEIMKIVGIGSSEKLINIWRYGLPI